MLKHLVYHCYPLASAREAWQWNIAQLKQRWPLFDGRKIIAVATGLEADSLKHVQAYLGEDAEWIEVENDPQLGESVTWVPLWSRLQGEPGVTFRAHAKGVSPTEKKQLVSITTHSSLDCGIKSERHELSITWTPGPTPASRAATMRLWADILYQANLDYWPLVEGKFLAGYAMVGSLKHFYGRQNFPELVRIFSAMKTPWPAWQYLGSFYWVKNSEFFARDWQNMVRSFYGSEMWPGFNFDSHETACLFHDTKKRLVPMNHAGFTEVIARKFERWKAYQSRSSDEMVSVPE